jgi:L-serine dehydratase
MKFRFHNLAELMEILRAEKISAEGYALKREAFLSGLPEDAVRDEVDRRIEVTRASLLKGLKEPRFSRSGLTRGAAAAFFSAKRRFVDSELFRRAVSYALAINEVNACGGKIVAFPTAGSSGIVPGTIWAWWDCHAGGGAREGAAQEREALSPVIPEMLHPPYDSGLRAAFLVSGLAGILTAQRAALAGSEGGCQAECGTAGAMAACALAYLEARPLEDCFSAAALSLKNSLGLACDPVAGLVEVPCVKRNAFVAANALLAVDLCLSGIKSVIPFDEVVLAMKQIGDAMPANIKENAAGGLALTPTGLSIRKSLNETDPRTGTVPEIYTGGS